MSKWSDVIIINSIVWIETNCKSKAQYKVKETTQEGIKEKINKLKLAA